MAELGVHWVKTWCVFFWYLAIFSAYHGRTHGAFTLCVRRIRNVYYKRTHGPIPRGDCGVVEEQILRGAPKDGRSFHQ